MALNILAAQPTKYKVYVVRVGQAEFIYSGKRLVALVVFNSSPTIDHKYYSISLSYRQQKHLEALYWPFDKTTIMSPPDFTNLVNIVLAQEAVKPFI